MKTKMEYLKEMEQSGVLMQRELTFPEYADQLMTFQDIVCKMIAGETYHEGMRIGEAAFLLESEARKRGIRGEEAVHNGVLTMKKLSKEIAITMSGIKGERLVSRTLEFMSRPNTRVFRNVYVSDGQEQTELDTIVLTDAGAIILEIKRVPCDLTLTEDGRMVLEGKECHDDIPLCEKMARKRKLLQKYLARTLTANGLDIPVVVDSYIVFSAPKGLFIHVDDRYRREKYCFRSGLNRTLENCLGCACYKEAELEQLGGLISEMETNVKRFKTKLDFDEVRQSLAEAMSAFQNGESNETTEEPTVVRKNTIPVNTGKKTDKPRKVDSLAYVAASVVAGVVLSGLAAVMGGKARRS